MSDEKMKATAKVKLTLEIPIGSSWGKDCTVDQVMKQAKNEAADIVHRVIYRSGLHVKILSTEVKAVFANEQ